MDKWEYIAKEEYNRDVNTKHLVSRELEDMQHVISLGVWNEIAQKVSDRPNSKWAQGTATVDDYADMADRVFGKYQTERKNGRNHNDALDAMYLD